MYSNRLPAGFLPLFSHSLLVSYFPCHTHWSVNFEKWTEQKHFPERTCNYPYLIFFFIFFFFGTRGLTARLDQISQFAMETTHRGASNYWRDVVDAQERDKKGNSKLPTTERLFQRQSAAAQLWMRFLVWQVREFQGATEGMSALRYCWGRNTGNTGLG